MVPIAHDVSLAPRTTFGVGGAARFFTDVRSLAELEAALAWARARSIATFILGGGSNLIVSDAGVDALVIHVALSGVRTEEGGAEVLLHAAAGEAWDPLVGRTVDRGWAGLECLSGIPGYVGATPIQNVGAYGQEVSHTIRSVVAVERSSGERRVIAAEACGFAYRDSVFKRADRDRFVIAEVTFALVPGGPASVRYGELERALGGRVAPLSEVRATVITLRRAKSMVLDPADENGKSAGSFFMNPIVSDSEAARVEARARELGVLGADETMPRFAAGAGAAKLAAGWLIERAGLAKGMRRGNVGLSTRHALAVVNHGQATAAEVIGFARFVQERVVSRFGVRLAVEPELVGFGDGELRDLLPT